MPILASIETSAVDFLVAYGQDLKIIITTLFGSAGMYVFSSYKGFDNSINFLKRMMPGRSDTFYYRSDFVVMSLSGTIIGLITFSPQGIYQALAAGFGWAGAMNVLLKADPPHSPGG
jgi:hypothetical protein